MQQPADTSLPLSRLSASSATRGCWFWAGWEPDRYYRRIGARKTPYFGNGEWVQPWREKLESSECLSLLAQTGATVLVTRFYKGFGPEFERDDWASLKKYVERAHDAGLQVWGYVQGQSIFGEFLFNERPEATDWVAQKPDGSPLLWADAYNRYAPCLTSIAHREMMEDIVAEGLESIGLDGIHLDNNYYRHCYCPRCKDLFREWLTARGDLEQRTGLPSADHVEPPPLIPEATLVPDPLALLWIEFGVTKRADFLAALRKKIRSIRPDATFAGNPGFMRSYASQLTAALDPTLESDLTDSICIENGNQPRYENGRLFTQADKHLFAEASGLRTWVTSWRPGAYGSSPPDTTASVWAGLAEEFSFRHSYLGNNWALRASGDSRHDLLFESLPSQWQTFRETLSYFQNLERYWHAPDRTQWGEVALYFDPRAFSICPQDSLIFQAFLLSAFQAHIPLRLVLRGQPIPPETHTLLVVHHRALAHEEIERLTQDATAHGRELWRVGECGVFDEWCVSQKSPSADTSSPKGLRHIPASTSAWLQVSGPSAQYFKGHCPSLTDIGRSELQSIWAALSPRLQISIATPPGLLSNVEKTDDRWFIHLRQLGPTPGNEACEITIRTDAAWKLEGHAPNWDQSWEHQSHAPKQSLKVPAFEHYAGITITRRV